MLKRVRLWPPNYTENLRWRQEQLLLMRTSPDLLVGAKEFYKTHHNEFIEDWCYTFDPRNASLDLPTTTPFIPFQRQRELGDCLLALIRAEENGLIEKCRDMGATWYSCAFSVWLYLFWDGASVGWGSRKADLVDRIGDPDSIFEKIRIIIRRIPTELLPIGFNFDEHSSYMRLINPETGASITGESGDNIGRGGRKLIYFKDESAHYERPESIEAALTDNTRVQIDISSVNGLGNVFHRKREAGVEWEPDVPIKSGYTHVFIMDWRDHPGKSQTWYDERKAKAEREGLLHIFYQEVDRNYAASVEGVIIPLEWIKSAIDAHIKLGIADDGGWVAALDVADEGGDRNSLAKRKGVILKYLNEWGEGDTGKTARKAVVACETTLPIDLNYDSVGVGSGIKAETNRLIEENAMPLGIKMVPWNAGAAVQDPEGHIIPDDEDSPVNEDVFYNFKSQAWWSVRTRFWKTHQMVTKGVQYPHEDLISIPSTLPKVRQLEKELCQVTAGRSTGKLKLLINKKPNGTRSPNLADSVVMCYFPATPASSYDSTLAWVGAPE